MIDLNCNIRLSNKFRVIILKDKCWKNRSFEIVLNREGIIDSRMTRVRNFRALKHRVILNRITIRFHVINFRAKFRSRDNTRNNSRKFQFIIFVKNDVSPKSLSNQLFNKTSILFMLISDLKVYRSL